MHDEKLREVIIFVIKNRCGYYARSYTMSMETYLLIANNAIKFNLTHFTCPKRSKLLC